jgi:hypothetical protein
MATTNPQKPRLFIDADVLIAGSSSPTDHSASLLVLRLAEITLIEALAAEQVVTEANRNLEAKLPLALPAFRHLVSRCLTIVPDPGPRDLASYQGMADPKDLPILVAAIREGCTWLVTFNIRHYKPGHPDIKIFQPGEFVLQIRDQLSHL